MSRPPAPSALEQPGEPPSPQNSSRWSSPPGPTPARPRRKTPTALTPPTGATIAPGRGGDKTSSWCSPDPQVLGSTSPPAPPGRPARSHARSAPSSGGSRRSCGVSPSAASRWTARTGTSPPCWRGSAAPKVARQSRRRPILPEDLLAMIATLDLSDLPRPEGSRDPPHRLRRGLAALGDRRPRLPPRGRPPRGVGSNFLTTACC